MENEGRRLREKKEERRSKNKAVNTNKSREEIEICKQKRGSIIEIRKTEISYSDISAKKGGKKKKEMAEIKSARPTVITSKQPSRRLTYKPDMEDVKLQRTARRRFAQTFLISETSDKMIGDQG